MKPSIATLLIFPVIATSAHALDLRNMPGRQMVTSALGERQDFCVLPKKLPGFAYREKSLLKDQETESELCGYDLYQEAGQLAACPKLNSTNPGVTIYRLKEGAGTRKAWETAECGKADPEGEAKTVAKFKQSMTCSYAPSPLAYYHISRVLDAQPIVPISVLRTMDARTHADYVKKGGAYAKKLYTSGALLTSWTRLWPTAHQTKPATLFDSSGTQLWGVLMEAPKGKELYSEVFKKPGAKFNYDTRYQDFKQTTPYLKLANAKPIAASLGTELANVAPVMVQLKDVSDMIVLDYLLNQQDRMGNVHYLPYYLYLEGGKIKDKKMKKDDAELAAEMKAKGAVEVKRMLLSDNDCGVAKDNMMRHMGILEGVNHMSLDTYRRLLWLTKQLKTEEWRNYFRQELQFTAADLDQVHATRAGLLVNAANAVKLLQEKCRKGILNLDLNIQLQIQGKNITDSKPYCDLPAGYQPGV